VRWDVVGADGERVPVVVTGDPADAAVQVGDEAHRAGAVRTADGLLLTLDGATRPVLAVVDGDTTWVAVDGAGWPVVEAPPARVREVESDADAQVRSPMPGAVIAVHVTAGETVTAGTPLLAVEAMKMEHVLRAPQDGTVELLVRLGDQVVVDQPLATVHAEVGDA
jgi:acetyl-CoA/propionyl-CoA carboxylase biotin carboxyl carrier protein